MSRFGIVETENDNFFAVHYKSSGRVTWHLQNFVEEYDKVVNGKMSKYPFYSDPLYHAMVRSIHGSEISLLSEEYNSASTVTYKHCKKPTWWEYDRNTFKWKVIL